MVSSSRDDEDDFDEASKLLEVGVDSLLLMRNCRKRVLVDSGLSLNARCL